MDDWYHESSRAPENGFDPFLFYRLYKRTLQPFIHMSLVRNHGLRWAFLVAILPLFLLGISLQSVQGEVTVNTDANGDPEQPITAEEPIPPLFPMEKPRMITVEELSAHDGQGEGAVIWLSILGEVYDVTKGAGYYKKGAGYSVFAARDGSVPFITGNFTEEEAQKPILETLSDGELWALDDWRVFYANEERYPFIGLLLGSFYEENGSPTEEMQRVRHLIANYVPRNVRKRQEREAKKKLEEEAAAAAAAEAATIDEADVNKDAKEGGRVKIGGREKEGGVKRVITSDKGEL